MTERDIELPAPLYKQWGTGPGIFNENMYSESQVRAAVLADRLRASEALAEEARILRRKWLGHRDTGHLSLTEAADQVIGGLHAQIASASEAAGWRPIETAPKDGTEVLLWREDCGQFIGSYTSADSFMLEQKEIDQLSEEELFDKDWFTQWPDARRLEGTELPTLWQLLPASPTLGTEGETRA